MRDGFQPGDTRRQSRLNLGPPGDHSTHPSVSSSIHLSSTARLPRLLAYDYRLSSNGSHVSRLRQRTTRQLSTAITQITTPTDAESAGALLGRVFAAEPWTLDLVPDETERLRFCTLLYTGNVRWSLHRGSVWTIDAEPGVVGGVLTLLEKPVPKMTDAEATAYGFDPVDREYGEILAEMDSLEGPALAALDFLPAPWCYINVLGVDPTWQGRGLGTTLMHHAITRADSLGQRLGLITDTERNVRFYQRLGFTTVREAPESYPLKLWSMVK